MTKSELISNGYRYVTTVRNGAEIWGKLIDNTPNNELLHYYYFSPAAQKTICEPIIVSGQDIRVSRILGETFNIANID